MHYQIVEITPAPVVCTTREFRYDQAQHVIKECDVMTPIAGDFESFESAERALRAYIREDMDFTVYAILTTVHSFPIKSFNG